MKNPLISVIVPIYNVEKYLDRCIYSIKQQTYKNIEVILVDDGSPDNCGNMCDEYVKQDSRFRVIHKQNEGLGFARNSGLDIARGEYVVFIDSDDFVKEEYIEKMYSEIKNKNVDTVVCGICKYYNKDRIIRKNFVDKVVYYENDEIIQNVLLAMIGANPEDTSDTPISVSVWHELYSMEIIRKHNIRFHSEREFISEDIIFQIDYFKYSKKVAVIPDTLYYYFCAQEDSLSTKYRDNRFAEEKILLNEIQRKLNEFLPEKIYKQKLQRFFLGRARTCMSMELQYSQLDKFRLIVYDPILEEILKGYPYWKNPWKLRIFNYFLKKKSILMLKNLISIKNS